MSINSKIMIKNSLSIIIPAYNEVNNIKNLFYEINEIKKINKLIEIIIVNDGSTDGTKLELEKLNLEYDNFVNIINLSRNKGYGHAIKKGAELSKSKYLSIIDADQTYPFQKIPEMYNEIVQSDYSMIVGSRKKALYKNWYNYLNPKNLAREMVRIFATIMSKKNIKDINSGLRVFLKKDFDEFDYLYPDGFSLTSTQTCLFAINNYKIKYIDIDYQIRVGESKIRPIRDFINFFNIIFKVLIINKPLNFFLPIFIVFFMTGSTLIFLRLFFIKDFFFTGFSLITLSFIFLFFGYVFEMLSTLMKKIKKRD